MRNGNGAEASSRFQVVGPLGSGGFGSVYEAVEVRTGRRVALKKLEHATADNIARFKHEFRALADCHHPHLVSLYELIEEDGKWLIVMELVPGCDLLRWVTREPEQQSAGEPRLDEGRLRGALSGVVAGLAALHEFGILHRDLKPSNVRVRPDGHAVLLDFGLSTSMKSEEQSMEAIGLGTVRYMAPEQSAGRSLGPATDFYALGVCLFEALTGRAPFEHDNPVAVLLAKQAQPAPRASSFRSDIAPDLDELCARLLALDPKQRPDAGEVLYVLGGSEASEPRKLSPLALAQGGETLFAGREPELAYLERALHATHQGELRIVLIEGESGVGKSELVAEFIRRTQALHPKLAALRGRCYENEQVSYKAFDGCIDELSKLLRRMPEEESAALLPARAALLGQLFPVLRLHRPIARAAREGSSADPTARRLEAFAALASLLGKLAEERPVVLVLDDLQWADAESFRLLNALLEHAPPVLLLGTIRPREELETDVLAHANGLRNCKQTGVVQLFGLPTAQAKSLAKKLLSESTPEAWLDIIAQESGGHPLFLNELMQYTRSHDFGARGKLTLDAALRARVGQLEQRTRELLELVALAARPHGSHVFARALLVPDVDEPARTLLGEKLLKLRKGQELGCYHDRIRRAVAELIPPVRVAALHRQLATALSSTSETDSAEQARHWDLAGEREHAVAAYELAVAHAIETLAFTRAADLSQRALELIENASDESAQRLRTQRAYALACAGRSYEAALIYQEAADRAYGEQRIRLRSRAAQHLMLGAKVQQGLTLARKVLVELGVSVPRSTAAVLIRYAWDRLWLAVHGSRVLPAETQRSVEHKHRLAVEIIDELSQATWLAQPLSNLTLCTQQLRMARKLGAGAAAALALSVRGWLVSMEGSLNKALPYFERSKELLKESGGPLQRGRQAHLEGSARLASSDWLGASVCLEHAQRLLQEHCPDSPWLLTNVRYHLGLDWYHLGEHRRLVREVGIWLGEARERNDVLGVALLSGMGHGFVRHLCADDPEAAHGEREQVLATVSAKPYSFVHFGHFLAQAITLLYQGGPLALRFLDRYEAEHKEAALFKMRVGREARQTFRLLASLSAAVDAPAGERERLLQTASSIARQYERSTPARRAYALLARAQIDILEGRREQALSHARAARRLSEAAGNGLRRHAALLEGLLVGGAVGHALQQAMIDALRDEGYRNPLRAFAIAVPMLPLLMRQRGSMERERDKLMFGRYELLEPLGTGGFGSVVAARNVDSGRRLALKELTRDGGKPLERFKREFRALQELHHENIGRLDAMFEQAGHWYIAMELVEGSDLLGYTRPGNRCDLSRVALAFAGLARGLIALHEAGYVHRDVAPSNVRVTSSGRAVLLDFGLIARIDDRDDAGPIGTAAYAPPEQLDGSAPAPSADVYALGTCLYEALFGRLPYQAATPAAFSATKRRERPVVLTSTSGFDELAACCLRMLAVDARSRPGLRELVAVLERTAREQAAASGHANLSLVASYGRSIDPQAARHPSDGPSATGQGETALEVSFLGRADELMRLTRAYARARASGFTIALLHGESGVGKSALASEFARSVSRSRSSVRVLRSRCYENELVAFKVFDGAVDHFAELLSTLSRAECEALLPKKAALLAQLFPVLTRVPAIADAPKKGLPADPSARRVAARQCFLELLENLSGRHELMFIVDDLQWADSESFALLQSLCEQRKLPLFFLCTLRPISELNDEAASAIARFAELPTTESVVLHGLSQTATAELAQKLHGAALPKPRLEALVRESKGHPLFLRELVAHEKSGGKAGEALSLDDALRARITSFSPEVRELLALVALAARPLGAHVFARALKQQELSREVVTTLLAHGLLRRRGEDELICYHDRIRSVALDLLTRQDQKRLSATLAEALDEERTAEPAERARLWEEAENHERARAAYEQAGDRALEGLAFQRAEQHYARALELLALHELETSELPTERRRLLEQRGHALARGGRSSEAARLYAQAAETAQGETQVRLRIWAAQHLMQSAEVDGGMRAAKALLAELGVALPASDRAATVRMVWERARTALRGTALRSSEHAGSQRERLVLDALRGLSAPVRAVSYLPGSTLVAQYLRRALAAGDPIHAARALACEALFRVLERPARNQDALFEQSARLAEEACDNALVAEVELLRGLGEITQSKFGAARAPLSHAHELLQTRCPGEPWLLTSARIYLGSAWFYRGDFAELCRHTGAWLEEAAARDDRYAIAGITGFGCASVRRLLQNAPEQALAELESALAPWPEEPYTTNHFGAFNATGLVRAYMGGPELLTWLDSGRARRERVHLMRTPSCRLSDSALTAIGIEFALVSARGSERAALLRRGEVEVQKLRRNPAKGGPALGHLHLGVLRAAAGKREEARKELSLAERELAALGHYLAPAARYLDGVLEGGDAGQKKREGVLALVRDEGWSDPDAGLSFRVPGLHLVE